MTNETVIESVKKLRELSPKLNRATDEASAVVASVECFLNEECSLGLPCWVTARREKGTAGEVRAYLGYNRFRSKFRIVVATETPREEWDDASGEPRCWTDRSEEPWTECTRDMKLVTFPKLLNLLHEIRRNAEETIKKTAETAKAVTEIVKALGESKQPSKDVPQDGQPMVQIVHAE